LNLLWKDLHPVPILGHFMNTAALNVWVQAGLSSVVGGQGEDPWITLGQSCKAGLRVGLQDELNSCEALTLVPALV
jgi:hypothetical protein